MLKSLGQKVTKPNSATRVFKDECSFSLASPESPQGIYICLNNYIGLQNKDAQKPTKLGIGVEGGFELPTDKYDLIEIWSLHIINEKPIPLNAPKIGQNVSDTSHLSTVENLPSEVASCIAYAQLSECAILAEERAGAAALWEDSNERPISKYAADLTQLNNGVKIAPSGWKCCKCDLKDNLWLNLSDGAILCGRKFFDGSGGNNHAVEHYETNKYPLAVKLGTITPSDDMVTDPHLSAHLAHWGIDVMKMVKTDKTIAELEISANEKLGEWLLLQESNKTLESRYGPGLTGLRNLGNSCYINSIIQIMFANEQFRWRYAYNKEHYVETAMNQISQQLPIDNFGLQLAKVGHGLCSGEFSWKPITDEEMSQAEKNASEVPKQPGIRALLLRRIIGKNHQEFATKRLQDAHEFMEYVLSLVEKDSLNEPPIKFNLGSIKKDVMVGCPVQAYQFGIEERLECGTTHAVKYSDTRGYTLTIPVINEAAVNSAEVAEFLSLPEETRNKMKPEETVRPRIPFVSCVNSWIADCKISDWISPATQPPGQKTFALLQRRLKTFPEHLCFHLARFTVSSDWTPKKLDIEMILSNDVQKDDDQYLKCLNEFRLDLNSFTACGGLQAGEVKMPDNCVPPKIEPDKDILAGLMEMGFPYEGCRKACVRTRNGGLKAAMDWVMEHMSDPDFEAPDAPEPMDVSAPSTTSQSAVDPAHVEMLTAMGLTTQQAERALKKCSNNLEAAADWALSNPEALNAPESPSPNNQSAGDRNGVTPETAPLTTGAPVYRLAALVSHMGKTTNDGHYVTHVRRGALSRGIPGVDAASLPAELQQQVITSPDDPRNDEWILFNDEKVAKSARPPFGFAYLYIFQRVDAITE